MTNDLRAQAEKLAAEPYTIELLKDETVDGKTVFVASHPELPGCMAQGVDIAEAIENLGSAAVEYIMSLLEDGLPVPSPSTKMTHTMPAHSVSHEDEYVSPGTLASGDARRIGSISSEETYILTAPTPA